MVPRLASNFQMRRGKILAVAGLLSLSQQSFCQWQDLDAFMLDQVESGWWIPQDRLLVLGHMEQTGSPVAHEEAFAIEGLSRQAAEALSKSSEWLDLVQQAGNDDSQGDGLGWEFRTKKDGWFNSLRFRNRGKWALRWDAGNGRPAGYAVVRGSRRPWRAIVGCAFRWIGRAHLCSPGSLQRLACLGIASVNTSTRPGILVRRAKKCSSQYP